MTFQITDEAHADPARTSTQLDFLFQRHPLPMWIYDSATLQILAANHAACVQYGYTADEFTTLSLLDLREPDDHPFIRDIAVSPEEFRRVCARHRRSDGSVLDVEVYSHSFPLAGRHARLVTAIDRSEQRDAERELRASRDFTRAIMEGVPDAIFVKDIEGRFAFANTAACRVAGLSTNELIGRLDGEVFGPETAAIFRENERPVVENATVVEDEEYFTVHGQPRIFQTIKVPWRSDTGVVKGVIGISRDVAYRKQIEGELQEVQERLRLVHDYSPFGSAISGLDGKWLHANPALCRMVGYSEQELQQRTYADITHPDDCDESGRLKVEAMLRGDTSYERRIKRYLHKSGRIVWVDLTVSIARNAQGQPAYFIVHVEDITQRRETEAALRAADAQLRSSQERLQMLMQQAPAVMWTTDRTLLINWSDGAGYRLLQRNPSDVIGTSILDWFAEGSPPVSAHRQALKGESSVYEVQLGTRWYNVHADPLRGDNASIIGVIALAFDVTVNKEAEEALRKQEEQLRQSQKMEAIGRLAGGVAHDFNNLLTAITGHSELLLDELDARDPSVADVEQIRRAAERAAALTRQLLAFSRRQILEPIIIDMHGAMADVEPLLRRLIGEDIELTVLKRGDSCRIRADKGQLEQVIMNLVVNARDAMPDGGRLVLDADNVVLTETQRINSISVPPGDYVRVRVEDSGTGISPEHLAHIFEPFFTTKDRDKGTGLGLSTVYGIIQQSGGHIAVESTLGVGTTFTICLPRVHELPPAIGARKSAASSARNGETILLVEDEDGVRELIARTLRRKGYTVMAAANGGEATLIAEQHNGAIDLLLTDVVMPRMSGNALARYLTQRHPALKVLFMSGYTDETIERLGVLAADRAFIQKPFTPDALAIKVFAVLDS